MPPLPGSPPFLQPPDQSLASTLAESSDLLRTLQQIEKNWKSVTVGFLGVQERDGVLQLLTEDES